MNELQALLKGKKTYIVAACGALLAAGSLLGLPGFEGVNLSSGDAVVASLVSLIGMTLRAGLADSK